MCMRSPKRDRLRGREGRGLPHHNGSTKLGLAASSMEQKPMPQTTRFVIHPFIDHPTWTVSYVVHAEGDRACAIIDPVLDYDPKSGRTRTDSADKLIAFVREKQLKVEWILVNDYKAFLAETF